MAEPLMSNPVIVRVNEHSDRKVADTIIIASTQSGKLDLDALATNINDVARHRATFDPHYKDALQNREAGKLADKWSERYNLAAREMLGITEPSLGTKIKIAAGFDSEPHNGLTCNVPKNVDFNNLGNSLRANNVSCSKPGNSR